MEMSLYIQIHSLIRAIALDVQPATVCGVTPLDVSDSFFWSELF